MTWLFPLYIRLNFNTKSVTLEILGRDRIKWEGIIFFIRAKNLVVQGCLAYLTHVWNVEVESPSIESIHVMSEFKEVFPTDCLVCLRVEYVY